MQVEVVESRFFGAAVADEIVSLALQVEREKVAIALSGGSTPAEVYRNLVVEPRVSEMPWEKTLFFLGDERWVPITDSQSNFFMAQDTFLEHVPKTKAFPVVGRTPEESASEYEKLIKHHLGEDPIFNIILLGLGDDGHTASLFPGSSLLTEESNRLVASCSHPETGQKRITFMPKLIQSAERVLVLVKGRNKAKILSQALTKGNTLPISILDKAKGKITYFVDTEAASEL
jgi:6-phosphogluconolactonase